MKKSLQNLFFLNKTTWSLGILFLLVAWLPVQSIAQTKVLANEVSYKSGSRYPLGLGGQTVENPDNALQDDNNYARLLASPGLAVGLGSYKGVIELKFAQTLPADTWSYVQMEGDSDLFRALLGGSLGNLLGDVLGAVIAGNQEIIIDARLGGNANGTDGVSVLSRSSTQSFGTDRVKLMQDDAGNNYLAIRPAGNYDRLRITNQIGSLLGIGNEKTLDVYNAFYFNDNGSDCGYPFATSFDGGGGIGLEVLDLNDQNLGYAIDNDENTFSLVKSSSVLALDVASTLSQQFYFPTVSSETTTTNIKLALGSGGLVNTDLLGAIEIIFYNDNTIVSRRSLQSSLLNNTNALNLLDSGQPVTLTFAPGKAFDRIAIKLNSPIGVNLLGNGIKIYDVQRYDDSAGCSNPEIAAVPQATPNPFDEASCESDLIDFDNVDFAHRAVDGNNESYATLYADAGSLLVSGPTAGFIEMDLGQIVPANKTTYVRINYDEDVLDRLLGGSLGKLVGDLANNLLLGNQYFEVEAKNGASRVLSRTSSNAFEGTSNGAVTLVQDNIGRYYIAITPDASYDRVRIINHVVALLPTGKKASLDVYNACFEIGTDTCLPANFTSYRGGGVGLSAGNISNVGVKNAYKAISENSSEYSEINLGVAGLLSHVYQTIYFSQPSQTNDKVKIRVAIELSSALALDVLGRYQVKFFNGATQVGNNETLQGGLLNNIDLLSLFNSGGIVELEYEPVGTFDRVEIGAESIASVNVAAEPLRVYKVERYGDDCPLTKTPFPFEVPSCSTTLIASKNADDVQNLFDDDFDSYATLKSGAGALLGLGNKYEGYVELAYDQPVAAGTTSYIRIDFDDGILEKLVGGSLGNVVSGLLDDLVLGNHFFKVEVKSSNGSIIDQASSNQASAGGNNAIRVIQDAAGRYYIAVTPTADYQSVRITDATDSLLGLLSQPNSMNVYGMCTELSTDKCLAPFATSYEYTGLSLSVNDLGAAGVTNPQYAINGNSTQASEIGLGTLSVAGGAKQWIFFNTVSAQNDVVNIEFKTGAGVADVALLGDLKIKAYLGNTEVKTLDWGSNGIINGVNVLDLINDGEIVSLPFAPGVAFDRISVGIENLVNVSVFPPLELYSVERCYDLDDPEFTSWKSFKIEEDSSIETVKGGEEIEYTIHIRNTGQIDLLDLIVEDAIPNNTTFVSAANGGTETSGMVTFENIDVAVGATETVSFIVKVNENLTQVTEITNVALVKLDENDSGTETFPPSEIDSNEPDESGATGTIIPVDQIKSVVSWKAYTIGEDDKTATSVIGGEEVTYHIYVRNTGNQDLTNVEINDELPAGITHISGGTLSGNTVSFTIPSLAVGATSPAHNFKVIVNKDLSDITEIKNIAVVHPDPNETDAFESFPPLDNENPLEPNETSTPGTILDVTPMHDIEFSKVGTSNNANNGKAQIGDEITYTLTVINTGNKTLTNVVVEDAIPANLSIKDNGNATTAVGNNLTFSIASLEVDEETAFTIIVEVDNLDGGITEIENTASVKYRNENDSADKTESAIHKMPTDCIELVASDITLTASKTDVCVDEEFTIQASVTQNLNNLLFSWFTNPALTGTPFVGDTLIESLTETTTFYVVIHADGYCFSTPPQEITITVDPDAEIPTITATDNNTEVCDGESVSLTATATGATSYQWYKDGVEILGATTATYDAIEIGSYTATAINATGCDSEPSAAIEVTILDLPTKPTIVPDGLVEVCEGEFVKLIASSGELYEWYYNGNIIEFTELSDPNDPNSSTIIVTQTINNEIEVNESGAYSVKVINEAECVSEMSEPTTITVNPAPKFTIDGSQMIYVATNAAITWPNVTAEGGNGSPIAVEWYDSNQNNITGNLPNSFADVGSYTYYVIANDGDCTSFESITVNVFDADACPPGMERVYATVDKGWGSIITGGVSNTGNATDGNPKTYSTITTGLGLLGIGTTWQNIEFDHTVPAGTPVTIKLGKEYSGLALAGGISVVGIKRDRLGTPIDIGVLKPVAGGLLDLLAADNVVEFTFVPSTISGAKDYDGVRISIGALLSVAQNGKIYGAYYSKPATGQVSCDPVVDDVKPYVQDILHGVKDLGLGVASSTASVVTPWNAVDNDLETSAKLVRGVSVLNAATLTVIFKQPVQPTDEIGILIKDITNNGLNLDLLTGYQFQRFMGDTPVGDPIQGGDVLNLKLLYFSQDKRTLMVDSYAEPYDRIRIAVGSIVQVALSDQMEIFDVSITPALDYGQIDDQDFEICAGATLELQMQDDCTFYEVYDENDTLLDTAGDSFSFIIPENTPIGENIFYVQAIRDGCPVGERQEIKVTVNPVPVLEEIQIDGTSNIFETTINASPGDIVEVTPIVNWGISAGQLHIWEMENPEIPGEWIAIPFAETEVDGTIKLTIPAFGEVVLPSGNKIDIRNTDINIRLTLESLEGCQTIEEGLILRIDGKSQLISNPNITNKLKN